MQIKLLAIGKTDHKQLQQLMDDYQKRLGHYIKFHLEIIPDIKNVKILVGLIITMKSEIGYKMIMKSVEKLQKMTKFTENFLKSFPQKHQEKQQRNSRSKI